jgi:acyl-CoA dehydrogenase
LATYGEALVRTEPGSERHRGLTMVLVDMRAPGVEVRPLRQMTGGCSFNEVFLQDVFVPDEMVLEGEGTGWQVALTTLMQERLSVGAGRTSPANTALHRLRQLVDHLGANGDPLVRQRLADLVVRSKVSTWFQQRAVLAEGGPGPEMSIAKLHFTSLLTDIAELACDVLGPAVIADTGDWGTFAWSEFVTGAPGMHIAGGTGQIQRNILAERVLGLPR